MLTCAFPMACNIIGHVTIVPHLSVVSFTKIFSNPSQASVQWCMRRGEKSTFPHISCIQTRCSIEIALHQCLAHVRAGRESTPPGPRHSGDGNGGTSGGGGGN